MASSSTRLMQLGARRCCVATAAKSTSSSVLSTTTRSISTPPSASSARRVAGAPAAAAAPAARIRYFSSSPRAGLSAEKKATAAQQREFLRESGLSPSEIKKFEAGEHDILEEFRTASKPEKRVQDQFWSDGELEPDMVMEERPEDEYLGDEMTSLAHGKLEDIRDMRHLARIIAWEMPLLAKFAKPFKPPTKNQILRFRYTSYMGELHPAEKKVVVEFSPKDIKELTDVQRDKLRKLAGVRYNPEKDIVRISCEMYEHQAQNKRYLGDLVNRLIAEAKDPTDTFEDIPLDTRHHKFKYKPKFPYSWRLTPERQQELLKYRAESFKLDQKMVAEGTIVDGNKRIEQARSVDARRALDTKIHELARPGAR